MKRAALLIIFFPLIALPAGALAIAALAFGCIAQLFAGAAGWLVELYDRLTGLSAAHQPSRAGQGEREQFDILPPPARAIFRDGRFHILRRGRSADLRDEVAQLRGEEPLRPGPSSSGSGRLGDGPLPGDPTAPGGRGLGPRRNR